MVAAFFGFPIALQTVPQAAQQLANLRMTDGMVTVGHRLGQRAIFAPMKSVMVAFSGGVDSTFVLKVAHQTIGDRVLALTTTSPTMPGAKLA